MNWKGASVSSVWYQYTQMQLLQLFLNLLLAGPQETNFIKSIDI